MVGWMQEEIAGFGVCMGADRVGCVVAYAMSSAGVLPTNGRGNLLPVGGKISGYMLASASSISPRAGGLEYRQLVLALGGCSRWAGQTVRVASNRVVALAEGINQLDDAPYPAIVDVHLAVRRGQEHGLLDMIRIVSRRNKADGWDKPDARLAGSAVMSQ